MKKLSQITESIWGDLARRSGGLTVRGENHNETLKLAISIYSRLNSSQFSKPELKDIGDGEIFAPYDSTQNGTFAYIRANQLYCNCDCYKIEKKVECLIKYIFVGKDLIIDRNCFSEDPDDIPEDYDSTVGMVMDNNGEVVGLSYSADDDLWIWIYNSSDGVLENNECDRTLAELIINITNVVNPKTKYTKKWFLI